MYKEAKTFKELRDIITKDGKTWEQRIAETPLLYHLTILIHCFSEITHNLAKLYENPKDTDTFVNYLCCCGYIFSCKRILEHQKSSKKLKKQIIQLNKLNKGFNIISDTDTLNSKIFKRDIKRALPYYRKTLKIAESLWLEEIKSLKAEHLILEKNEGFIKDIVEHSLDPKTHEKLKKVIDELSKLLSPI